MLFFECSFKYFAHIFFAHYTFVYLAVVYVERGHKEIIERGGVVHLQCLFHKLWLYCAVEVVFFFQCIYEFECLLAVRAVLLIKNL